MPNWSTRRAAKPKPQEDLPDFDENMLDLLRQIMPQGVIPTAWPLYRLGGSARHWSTPGGNRYVPHGFTQVGVYQWTGEPDSHVITEVHFPTAFSGKFLLWLTIIETTPQAHYAVCIGSGGGAPYDSFWLSWWSQGFGDLTAIKVAWLAMGPGAGT